MNCRHCGKEVDPDAPARRPPNPPLRCIVDAVSRVYGVPTTDIVNRRSDVGRLVQIMVYLCRRAGGTYSGIGRTLRRHHTTIMHAERRVSDWMPETPDADVATIESAWELAQSMRDKRFFGTLPGDVG